MQKKWWFLFAFVFFALASQAQKSRSELEKERSAIQREIDDIRKALNETSKTRKSSLTQLALLQRKLRLREKAIGTINQEIKAINDNMYLSALEIKKLKNERDTLKQQYAESLVYAYKNRSNYDFLNFIFSASNFNDALKRMAYLKTYRQYREQKKEEIERTELALQAKIDQLKLVRQDKDKALESANRERAVLAEEKKEQDQVVAKLRSKEKELNKEIANKRALDKKLQASINAAIKRELAAAREEEKKRQKALEDARKAELAKAAADKTASPNKPTTTTTPATKPATPTTTTPPNTSTASTTPQRAKSDFEMTPEGVISSTNFEKNRGSLPWPLETGTVVYDYGPQTYEGTSLKFDNDGWTFQTPIGQPVKAIFDGEVTSVNVFDMATGSQVVMLKHGKYFSVYGGVVNVTVTKGQHVKAGQVLGKAATSMEGVGEMEFRLLNETKFVNPALWLKRK